jgi:FKBP-type peptidyl-prolyl cis-trans isomerase 2
MADPGSAVTIILIVVFVAALVFSLFFLVDTKRQAIKTGAEKEQLVKPPTPLYIEQAGGAAAAPPGRPLADDTIIGDGIGHIFGGLDNAINLYSSGMLSLWAFNYNGRPAVPAAATAVSEEPPLIFLLVIGVLIPGCSATGGPAKAKDGNTVQVNYTGKLADGTVFNSSIGRQPLEVILGTGQVIPGFEKAIWDMKAGEIKTVTISVNEAYGPSRSELIFEVPNEELPTGVTPQVGQQLQGTKADGSIMVASITKISDKAVTLDANTPLAGKDLTFEIELIKILQVPRSDHFLANKQNATGQVPIAGNLITIL